MDKEEKKMKVIFEKDFDFHPKAEPRSIIAYYANPKPQTVTRECGQRAIKAGFAKLHEEKKDASGKTKTKA